MHILLYTYCTFHCENKRYTKYVIKHTGSIDAAIILLTTNNSILSSAYEQARIANQMKIITSIESTCFKNKYFEIFFPSVVGFGFSDQLLFFCLI